MKNKRLEELVNSLINYIMVGENISEVKEILTDAGFTDDELEYFGFNN